MESTLVGEKLGGGVSDLSTALMTLWAPLCLKKSNTAGGMFREATISLIGQGRHISIIVPQCTVATISTDIAVSFVSR